MDWLNLQIARCICALYWINPLCWITYRKMSAYAEEACDDRAIHSGIKKVHYANDLVNVAVHVNQQTTHNIAALSMAASGMRTELGQRILAILNPNSLHAPITCKQATLTFFIVAFMFLPLASIRANYVEKVQIIITYPTTDSIPVNIGNIPEDTNSEAPLSIDDYKRIANIFEGKIIPEKLSIQPPPLLNHQIFE